MTLDDSEHFDPAHLQRWWRTTLAYMLTASTSEVGAADPLESTLHLMTADASAERAQAKAPQHGAVRIGSAWPYWSVASHGGQRRFISRM